MTEEEAKESYTCTVEGYLPEWLHGNGDKHPAYIIEVVSEPGELYPLRVGDVKRLLPRRVDTGGDDSDAEAVGREEVVDEHLTGTRRGGKQKGAAAAARDYMPDWAFHHKRALWYGGLHQESLQLWMCHPRLSLIHISEPTRPY